MRPAYRRVGLAGPQEITEATSVEPYDFDYIYGFCSALVSLYSDAGMLLEQTLDAQWKSTLTGYHNVANEFK